MPPGASASPGGKTFLLTTTTVSIAWADPKGFACARRQTGGRAVRRPSATATAGPPVRQTAAVLFDRVKALVQGVHDVARGVVPRREVEGGVYAPGDLAHPARDEREGAAHRIRPDHSQRPYLWRPVVSPEREAWSQPDNVKQKTVKQTGVEEKRRGEA